MSEAVYCLLSYCAELENKSHDITTLIYLIFDHICELADKYPDKIEYREEIEVLMHRILLRPIADYDSDEEYDEEDKTSSSSKNDTSSEKPKQKSTKPSGVTIDSSIRKLIIPDKI